MVPKPDREYLAAFLDVKGRPALVVGGGGIGERKAEALLRAGARVTVVAPALGEALARWARAGAIEHRARRYEATDLEGFDIAIAATDDAAINAAIGHAARARRIAVNVADDPRLSTFIMPAVIDRLPVQIAVTTAGASPVLARRLREAIEAAIPPAFGTLAALAARFRTASMRRFPDPGERRAFWERMLEGPLPRTLAQDGEAQAEAMLRSELGAGDADAGASARGGNAQR